LSASFVAIVDHHLSREEILTADVVLAASYGAIVQTWSGHPDLECTTWQFDPPLNPSERRERFESEGVLELVGPCGFWIYLSEDAGALHHRYAWSAFLCNLDLRRKLRATSNFVGRCLGATQIVYVADSSTLSSVAAVDVANGHSFQDAVTRLERQCGAPETDIASIHKEFNAAELVAYAQTITAPALRKELLATAAWIAAQQDVSDERYPIEEGYFVESIESSKDAGA